jgi:hypothetical protein
MKGPVISQTSRCGEQWLFFGSINEGDLGVGNAGSTRGREQELGLPLSWRHDRAYTMRLNCDLLCLHLACSTQVKASFPSRVSQALFFTFET